MHGLAALAAALAAAVAQPGGPVSRSGALLRTTRAPLPAVLVMPVAHHAQPRSCSTQPAVAGRRFLPVACEQPPRSSVVLPNLASGGLSPLLGGGR
jgi:hypothetical protein